MLVFAMTTQTDTFAHIFSLLEPFYGEIFTSVRNDLRDQHLRTDKAFLKKNFPNKRLSFLTADDFAKVYPQRIVQGHESLGEFIANRWLLKHLEIYNFFEDELKKIHPAFEEISALDELAGRNIMLEAVKLFGAKECYIFALFNGVRFSQSLLDELRQAACQKS